MTFSAPKSDGLRDLFWRSEILRVVYWLYGEGLGDLVDEPLLRRYLGVDGHESLAGFLDGLVADGSMVREGEWYVLSARGRQDGEAQLATAFSELVPASGQCNDECWCAMSRAEAEACERQRTRSQDTQAGKAHA